MTGPPRQSDLIVAGGGPVGLATALYARQAGLRVTVIEPRTGLLDKACGEGVMPSAVLRLAKLGVMPPGRPFQGITYVDGRGRRVTADFPHGPGRGVRRTALQSTIRGVAHAAGVERVTGSVGAVTHTPQGVEVAVGETTYTASYLAAADGLHSGIRQQLGLDRPTRRYRRYGLRRHFAVEPWSDHVEVHWAKDAEMYVTPVGDDLVGIAILTAHRKRTYQSWLTEFPEVAQRLLGAEPTSRVLGAGPLRQRARQVVDRRVLLVGDAAGYVDALTGEGLAVGLASAEALVEAIIVGRPEEYAHAWRDLTRTSRVLTETLLRGDPRADAAPGAGPVGARVAVGLPGHRGSAGLGPAVALLSLEQRVLAVVVRGHPVGVQHREAGGAGLLDHHQVVVDEDVHTAVRGKSSQPRELAHPGRSPIVVAPQEHGTGWQLVPLEPVLRVVPAALGASGQIGDPVVLSQAMDHGGALRQQRIVRGG